MIKFRLFSKYDYTDSLKDSVDSSILNKEEKGKMSDSTKTGLLAGAGAILGASGKSKLGGKIVGGTKGALIGTAIGVGYNAMKDASKRSRENAFYNSRLREAKRAAKRREQIDWNNRIHYRQGYE
jgi:uncharacterized membrane protein YebE (DUF533 family)